MTREQFIRNPRATGYDLLLDADEWVVVGEAFGMEPIEEPVSDLVAFFRICFFQAPFELFVTLAVGTEEIEEGRKAWMRSSGGWRGRLWPLSIRRTI